MKDLTGRDIEIGSYLVQAFNLGRCAALKFSVVVKINDKSIRAVGCEFTHYKQEWCIGGRPFNIQYGSRSFIVDKKQIPLEAYILLQEAFIQHYSKD